MQDLIKIIRFLDDAAREIRFRRELFALSILTGIVSGLLSATMVALVNRALHSEGAAREALAWQFLGLSLLVASLRFGSGLLLNWLVNRARVAIEIELCQRVLAAPLRRIEKIGSHRVLATLASDVNTIATSLSNFPTWLRQATIVYGCLMYMAVLSWIFFLSVLAFLILGSFMYLLPRKLGRRRLLASREMSDVVFRHLRSLTEGIKELKIHRGRRHAFGIGQLMPALVERSRNQMVARAIFLAAGSWGTLFTFLVLGFLVFLLPAHWDLESEVVTGYVLSFLYLVNPFNNLMNQSQGVTVMAVAADKIEKLGLSLRAADLETDSAFEKGSAAAEKRPWTRIELAGVSHSYSREDGASFTLGPVDLAIEKGECLFLIGGNGSGKTTLAKLLTGLYRPEKGEVLLDGKPVLDHNLEDYRQLFSVVFNDFHLFESLLGLDGPDLDARAGEYLRILQLDKKLEIRDGKLSTTRLSQGQRKRLALLTAYLEDRSIYLFDEWAADQDPHFKSIFYNQLLPDLRGRGKTLIVISHDDRYYDRADRIVKLVDGRIELDERVQDSEIVLGEARQA